MEGDGTGGWELNVNYPDSKISMYLYGNEANMFFDIHTILKM